MGIYVHVPFCVHKCGYCDFNSWAEEREGPQRIWLEALERQTAFWTERISGQSFDTVFFGGGTPSLLTNELILKAMELIRRRFQLSENAEITWEVNPETLNEEKLATFQGAGVNRLSMGVQSFQNRHLDRLERRARREDNFRALELLSKNWLGRWSLDLMFGLPGQDLQNWFSDLQEALQFHPKHISAYQLTLTTERSKNWEQPPEENLLELMLQTVAKMKRAGLDCYEVSNFAIPGEESRHNLKYWELDGFLGLGPGAAGLIPGRWLAQNPENRWGYHQKNPDHFDKWAQGAGTEKGEWTANLKERDEKMHLQELLMMGLRLKKGIEKERLGHFVGRLKGPEFQENQGYIGLSDQAMPLLNTHLEEIFIKIDEFMAPILDSRQIDPKF